MLKKVIGIAAVCLLIIGLFPLQDAYTKKFEYRILTIDDISRYTEDRVMYQQIEITPREGILDSTDNSIATLLIIRDKKVYIIKDGFDNPENVRQQKIIGEVENKPLIDLWANKIDNKPDFMRINDRRVFLMKNESQEYVTKNYGELYTKVRDEYIKKHTIIFVSLMINRKESGISVERKQLNAGLFYKGPQRYATTVTARTLDEKVYFAEDADGDGITETFAVSLFDGFTWGSKCGPNVLFIYQNKQKDIEKLIGRLCDLAYNGSSEEENVIKKVFPGAANIQNMINDIYKLDADSARFLKENNINLERALEQQGTTPTK